MSMNKYDLINKPVIQGSVINKNLTKWYIIDFVDWNSQTFSADSTILENRVPIGSESARFEEQSRRMNYLETENNESVSSCIDDAINKQNLK